MNKIFSYNADIKKNAYLNWRTDCKDTTHNLYVLANDYAQGAMTLMDCILQDNSDKKADALIMPIFYSIDQSIEVYLKAIIRKIGELTENPGAIQKTHDIKELKSNMVAIIKKREIRTNGLTKHLQSLTEFIDELYEKIKKEGEPHPNMDFARYPVTNKGVPHFYIIDPENVVVDVENLKRRFFEINNSLKALYCMYEAQQEAKDENEQNGLENAEEN